MGADVNKECGQDFLPLFHSVAYGHTDVVSCLLKNGVDVNREFGLTGSLLVAVSNDRFEMVQLLLENGADLSGIKTSDVLPCYGERMPNVKIVKLLLEYGLDANMKRDDDGQTLLHRAVIEVKSKCLIDQLVKYGADVNALNKFGLTPLDSLIVCKEGFLRMDSLSVSVKNPLLTAVSIEMLQVLETHGAHFHKVKEKNNFFELLMFHKRQLSLMNNDPFFSYLVRFLIDHEVDVSECMSSCVFNQNIEDAKFLLYCGADPNVAMKTAIDGQAFAGCQNVEIIQVLLDHGADPDYAWGYISHLDLI